MATDEIVDGGQMLAIPSSQQRTVDIPNARPVTLQTLDLARHVAATPEGPSYIVATFNDSHMGRGYVTAIYPQQNGYLTLLRLVLREASSDTAEQALQLHIAWVQAIQQGKAQDVLQARQ